MTYLCWECMEHRALILIPNRPYGICEACKRELARERFRMTPRLCWHPDGDLDEIARSWSVDD